MSASFDVLYPSSRTCYFIEAASLLLTTNLGAKLLGGRFSIQVLASPTFSQTAFLGGISAASFIVANQVLDGEARESLWKVAAFTLAVFSTITLFSRKGLGGFQFNLSLSSLSIYATLDFVTLFFMQFVISSRTFTENIQVDEVTKRREEEKEIERLFQANSCFFDLKYLLALLSSDKRFTSFTERMYVIVNNSGTTKLQQAVEDYEKLEKEVYAAIMQKFPELTDAPIPIQLFVAKQQLMRIFYFPAQNSIKCTISKVKERSVIENMEDKKFGRREFNELMAGLQETLAVNTHYNAPWSERLLEIQKCFHQSMELLDPDLVQRGRKTDDMTVDTLTSDQKEIIIECEREIYNAQRCGVKVPLCWRILRLKIDINKLKQAGYKVGDLEQAINSLISDGDSKKKLETFESDVQEKLRTLGKAKAVPPLPLSRLAQK